MRKVLLALVPLAFVAAAIVPVLARGGADAASGRAAKATPSDDAVAGHADAPPKIAVPKEPERRSTAGSPARRALPTATVDWPARTLDYRLSGPGERTFTCSLVRRGDRIDIRFPLEAQEWHFERNPVDAAHFSGMLVNHRSRRILSFEFADLEAAGVASDWKTAGLLGFDPRVLETAFQRTDAREEAFGLGFEHFRALPTAVGQPTDVWWNPAEFVILRMVWRSNASVWTQELVASDARVDDGVLRSPLVRHPRYVAVDAVDALESQSCGSANCLPPSVKELMGRLAGNGTTDARRAAASHR